MKEELKKPNLPIDEYKYYTPSIEDIRVGYEYEEVTPDWSKWLKGKVEDFEEAYLIIKEMLPYKGIRTPYLTKEQIESEGWEISKFSMLLADFGNKENDELLIKIEKGEIYIVLNITKRYFLLSGVKLSCPSINEFRFITKLLNI